MYSINKAIEKRIVKNVVGGIWKSCILFCLRLWCQSVRRQVCPWWCLPFHSPLRCSLALLQVDLFPANGILEMSICAWRNWRKDGRKDLFRCSLRLLEYGSTQGCFLPPTKEACKSKKTVWGNCTLCRETDFLRWKEENVIQAQNI